MTQNRLADLRFNIETTERKLDELNALDLALPDLLAQARAGSLGARRLLEALADGRCKARFKTGTTGPVTFRFDPGRVTWSDVETLHNQHRASGAAA